VFGSLITCLVSLMFGEFNHASGELIMCSG
jgi:hypothetical protein